MLVCHVGYKDLSNHLLLLKHSVRSWIRIRAVGTLIGTWVWVVASHIAASFAPAP